MSRICLHLCVAKILSVLPELLVRRYKSASFINCSWHVIAELLAKAATSFLCKERHTCIPPKNVSAWCVIYIPVQSQVQTFVMINERMRYMKWDIPNFRKKSDVLFIKCWYGKVHMCVFWSSVSNTSFYGKESCSSRGLLYMTLLRYLQLYALKPHQRAPMLRSGIAQIRHIRRHPLSTHMTCSHLFTPFQNTFCLVSTCVSTSLGFIFSKIKSKCVELDSSQHFAW